jgi:hypothetical protein
MKIVTRSVTTTMGVMKIVTRSHIVVITLRVMKIVTRSVTTTMVTTTMGVTLRVTSRGLMERAPRVGMARGV